MIEKEEQVIIKIAKDMQKKADIQYINGVFDMMENEKYSDWTLADFKNFLIELINK